MTDPSGFVLPVDKPEGPTSHDVVDAARRALGERRIGHTGTLDPFASGLLMLCVGRATRLAEYLTGLDKSYEATARLGVATDTLDREGEIVSETDDWRALGPDRIERAFTTLVGTIDQRAPRFSAKKVGGVPLHRRARRGEDVEAPIQSVTVHELEVTSVAPPNVRFRMRCSSGTFVRAIARDAGEALGVGAHLVHLRRTAIGAIDVATALTLDDLSDAEAVAARRLDPLSAMGHLPAVDVNGEDAGRLAHGQKIRADEEHANGLVVVAHDGTLVAIAEVADGVLSPRKVFLS